MDNISDHGAGGGGGGSGKMMLEVDGVLYTEEQWAIAQLTKKVDDLHRKLDAVLAMLRTR